jgi:hypothetical protein
MTPPSPVATAGAAAAARAFQPSSTATPAASSSKEHDVDPAPQSAATCEGPPKAAGRRSCSFKGSLTSQGNGEANGEVSSSAAKPMLRDGVKHVLRAQGTCSAMAEAAAIDMAQSVAQQEAREERERRARVAAQKLSYAELFWKREQAQAKLALSDPETLLRDVRQVRKRLRASNRCIFDPDGTVVQSHDMLTAFALVYTVFITPYEIGFLSSVRSLT